MSVHPGIFGKAVPRKVIKEPNAVYTRPLVTRREIVAGKDAGESRRVKLGLVHAYSVSGPEKDLGTEGNALTMKLGPVRFEPRALRVLGEVYVLQHAVMISRVRPVTARKASSDQCSTSALKHVTICSLGNCVVAWFTWQRSM